MGTPGGGERVGYAAPTVTASVGAAAADASTRSSPTRARAFARVRLPHSPHARVDLSSFVK